MGLALVGRGGTTKGMNVCMYVFIWLATYISSGAKNTSLAQKEGSKMIAREGTGDDQVGIQIKADGLGQRSITCTPSQTRPQIVEHQLPSSSPP